MTNLKIADLEIDKCELISDEEFNGIKGGKIGGRGSVGGYSPPTLSGRAGGSYRGEQAITPLSRLVEYGSANAAEARQDDNNP
jgi:hypothetical protein